MLIQGYVDKMLYFKPKKRVLFLKMRENLVDKNLK